MTAHRSFQAARLAAASLLLAAAAGCAARAQKTDTAVEAPAALLAPSDVAVATRTNLAAGVPVSGTLDPAIDIKISAPFDEALATVTVQEGQRVAKGQVIARFRAGSVTPAAASAKAALELAHADVERYRDLLKAGAVSQRDLDAAEAQWHAAQATEAQARTMLDDASVRAPVSGTVARRNVQSGDRVKSGDAMFRIVNTSELEFAASVPAEYAPQVHVGAPVVLDVSGYPHGAITGRVARVNATTDPSTRQLMVYVRVGNRDGRLVGGLFATGAIVTNESREAIAVPAPALRTDGAARYVYAITRGRLEKRTVEPGVHDEQRGLAEIRTGVAAGDSIVTGVVGGLTPGQAIGIAATSEAPRR